MPGRQSADRWTGYQSQPAGCGEPRLEAGGRPQRARRARAARHLSDRAPGGRRAGHHAESGPVGSPAAGARSYRAARPASPVRSPNPRAPVISVTCCPGPTTATPRAPICIRWPDAGCLTSRWRSAVGTQRVAELARSGRPVLVDLTESGGVAALGDRRQRTADRCRWKAVGQVPATAVLVRPDGYVAWACRGPGPTRTNCANCAASSRIGSGSSVLGGFERVFEQSASEC